MNATMERTRRTAAHLIHAIALVALLALPAAAQDTPADNPSAPKATDRATPPPIEIAFFRAHDARGLNVFEPPKQEGVPYTGFKLQWGAAFTQQFQALDHESTADTTIAANKLMVIGPGFNNAEANLYLDAQIARGIRVALETYLSSRHHPETWVKDGYLLIDGSPWESPLLDHLMEHITLRLGHFEINYGDMHFRRTDNGEAMFNPLVGNLIMDAFTTEIGGEAYVRASSLLGMVAVTGGEVRGNVLKPEQRSPAVIAKLGFDRSMSDALRVRLTGSLYSTSKSISNTLYSGSRAGSRYYYVLENTSATESAQAWSGDLQPGFRRKVTAWVVNPFVKVQGLELFGNIEQAKGRSLGETSDRTWSQYAGEAVYRLFGNQIYLAGRYNVAKGTLSGIAPEVTVNRMQVGGGWFLTPNMVAKGEYVRQEYEDFPVTDIRSGGTFHGAMVEAVVSF